MLWGLQFVHHNTRSIHTVSHSRRMYGNRFSVMTRDRRVAAIPNRYQILDRCDRRSAIRFAKIQRRYGVYRMCNEHRAQNEHDKHVVGGFRGENGRDTGDRDDEGD